jgi:ribonuclease HI
LAKLYIQLKYQILFQIKAELRAAVLGLHFTWDYGYKQVELEMNSEIIGEATRGASNSLNKDDLFENSSNSMTGKFG